MTINVKGPDGSNFAFPDDTNLAVISDAMSKHYGGAAAPAAGEPVTVNKVVRSAAGGVPVVGGVLNKLDAATNATLAPVVEPFLTPSASDIGRPGPSTEKIGDIPLPAKSPGWMERYKRSLELQNKGDESFAAAHPYIDTAAKVAGGVAGTIPAMMAAPVAFGLTGTLPQMVARGAASNAALGAADAAVRGEDIAAPAAIGGAVGAVAPLAGRAVGKLVQGVRDMRNPPPVVPQNVERVAGVDIPLTTGQATADPAVQAEEEIMRRGARGASAEDVARQADQQAQAAVAEASGNITKSLDPAGVSPRTAPQAAGQVVQSELAQQEAARAAAESARVSQVGAEGESLARGLGGGAAPASPFDAAENVGAAVTARRDAKVAATREAYKARDAVAGEFDPSVPQGLAEDIRARLNTGENPLWVDPTNESTANKALKLIDQTLGKDSGILANSAIPKPAPAPAGAPAAAATEADTIAALRARFGDSVADAYAKQSAARAVAEAPAAAPPAPKAQSLLEFLASKGGLGPGDAELAAIGADGHTVNVEGAGRRKLVRQGGRTLAHAREAAEEAGYLRGSHAGTSTENDLLDAIDAEMRGRKLYPGGHEGHVSKRDAAALSEREQHELDRVNHGFEEDIKAAGYGQLGPEVRDRAVKLMHDGHGPDDAVEHALMQLEQEDAARAATARVFPGDRPAEAPASAAPAASSGPVDLKTMDEARKRLVTMYGDAKSAAIRSGDKSDMRAMGKILHEFDNSIGDALASGKFSGDAKLAKELQDAARQSHAEYRQTFSSRGPNDEIGRAVEKILGRYHDTAATPSEIAAMAYGPKSAPGSGNTEKIAMRLRDILGENSPEWAQYKQGLFQHIAEAEAGAAPLSPAKAAGRIDNFLHGKTSRFANKIFTPEQRQQMAQYARSLRSIEPGAAPKNDLEKAISRIAGTDGHLPASPGEVTDMLYSRTGKGDKGISQRLAVHLKQNLTPESWTAVRQGMWEKLTNAGEGKIPYEAQALSQRLHEFLNESGKGLSQILFSKAEREEIAKLAAVYRRMTPLKGTTNPSGSATIGAKIAAKTLNHLGAMIGFGAHGVAGAIVGHGVQKAAGALKDAKAAKEATRLFFGPQAKRMAATSRLPALIAPSAASASQR